MPIDPACAFSRRGPATALFRQRLRELAAERRRFGYRRLHVLLRREGLEVNRKRVQRLFAEEKLQMHRGGGRKRALGAGPLWRFPIGQTPDGRSTSSMTR